MVTRRAIRVYFKNNLAKQSRIYFGLDWLIIYIKENAILYLPHYVIYSKWAM